MYPSPSVTQLAEFTGRAEGTFSVYATTSLAMSALLFQLLSGLEEVPPEEAQAQLATYAILEMADDIYLAQPYKQLKAKPFSSESIGSYSYSKAAKAATSGLPSGLVWWDLALRELGEANLTQTGAITVLERHPSLRREPDGTLAFYGPADLDALSVPFTTNVDDGPHDLG